MRITLKPDKVLRDRLFTPESYQHPAKGHLGLWWEILERYTQPGQWVLDPMAGVGATMLGALMGRNIICVELEQHFIEPMRASWAKLRQSPMLGHTLGQVVILRGDARALPLGRADDNTPICPNKCGPWFWDDKRKCRVCPICGCVGLDKSLGRVDAAVFSPPWERSLNTGDPSGLEAITHNPDGSNRMAASMAHGYTRPSAIVTSPPYEGSLQGEEPSGALFETERRVNSPASGNRRSLRKPLGHGYTRPVDAVVTSPPYEGFTKNLNDIENWDKEKGDRIKQMQALSVSMPKPYSHDQTNIGNLRGPAYWEAMRLTYQECHRILAPGGLMVLVVKGFTRDGVYQDLPAQTRTLCETLGFSFVEEWQRELWSLSFWRILQGSEKKAIKMGLQMGLTEEDITEVIRTYRVSNGKLDDRLRFESVLVLRSYSTPAALSTEYEAT